jgi:hypothetical protein
LNEIAAVEPASEKSGRTPALVVHFLRTAARFLCTRLQHKVQTPPTTRMTAAERKAPVFAGVWTLIPLA